MKLTVFTEKSSGSSNIPQIRIEFPRPISISRKRALKHALMADIALRLEGVDPLHEVVPLNDSIAVMVFNQDSVDEVYKNLCMIAKVAGQRKIFDQACSACSVCVLEVSILGLIQS